MTRRHSPVHLTWGEGVLRLWLLIFIIYLLSIDIMTLTPDIGIGNLREGKGKLKKFPQDRACTKLWVGCRFYVG